ncbi:hypothetical protein [Clostridium sp.]|jgi:predicted RNA binding protein with dsRBD fold (UPF0201 family)|uniref:hypothetical protein n=1 Tax=Clostridium sp. TaxID=1506 RepID=UPI003EF077EF
MKNSYKEIYNILKKIRGRFVLSSIFVNICIGSLVAVIVGIILSTISRFIPIYNVYQKVTYICAAAIVMALFYSLIVRPDLKAIAAKVDSFELKERVSSAIEIENKECIYKELLARDALNNLKGLNYKKNISLIPKKKFLLSLCVLLVILLGSTLLPDPLSSLAEKNHATDVYKKQEVEKVNSAVKKVYEDTKLSTQQKEDLIAKLEELKAELKTTKDIEEVKKAVQKTTEKLALKKNEELSKDLKNLEAKLGENKDTEKLSEALKKNDKESVKKELDKLKEELKTMDENSKKDLKKTLSKASAATSNSDLKDGLDALGDGISSGDENAINSSVDQISKIAKKGTASEDMNKALAQVQEELQGETTDGQEQKQAQGQGAGQGQGSGSGSGSGQGQGAGGSGAGSGTGNKDLGVTPYGSGGTGTASGLTGKKNDNSGSSDSFITNNPNAELGNLKPYDQVIGEYTDKAMESLNSNEIPDGMRDVIKGYFTSLQD